MLTATWVLAIATALLALSSFVGIITWREGRRREREDQQVNKILESARKEFVSTEAMGKVFGIAILAGLIGLVVWSEKKEAPGKQGMDLDWIFQMIRRKFG